MTAEISDGVSTRLKISQQACPSGYPVTRWRFPRRNVLAASLPIMAAASPPVLLTSGCTAVTLVAPAAAV